MPAVTATQPQEAVRQDAAFQEGVELVLDERRQVGAGCSLKPARRRWRRAAAPPYAHCCGNLLGGRSAYATGRFGATSSRQRMSLMDRQPTSGFADLPAGLRPFELNRQTPDD